MSLRPYQIEGLRLLRESFKKGHKAACFVMATGLGKTKTMAAACTQHLEKKLEGRILWIAHREELVNGGYDELTKHGLSCAVIQAQPSRPVNPHRPVQVASIDTLRARALFPDGISLIISDECHHDVAQSRYEYLVEYKKRGIPILGATATPGRGDLVGLAKLYDDLVCPITVKEAIAQGYLVPPTVHAPNRVLGPGQIADDPHKAYKEFAPGRKAVVFATNVVAAEEIAKNFEREGIGTGLVTGQMDSGARRAILDAYAKRDIDVLVNVGIATEGWDDPPTDCVILARSIGSEGLYLQMCGRGLRLAPGKKDCIIIDLHGTVHKFGSPDVDREYSLEGERDDAPKGDGVNISFCEMCGCTMQGKAQICSDCNTARPGTVPPEVVGEKLIRYANKAKEPPEKRLAYFRKLQGIAASKGYSRWWPAMKFRAVYSEPVPKEWNDPSFTLP